MLYIKSVLGVILNITSRSKAHLYQLILTSSAKYTIKYEQYFSFLVGISFTETTVLYSISCKITTSFFSSESEDIWQLRLQVTYQSFLYVLEPKKRLKMLTAPIRTKLKGAKPWFLNLTKKSKKKTLYNAKVWFTILPHYNYGMCLRFKQRMVLLCIA